MNRWNHDGDTYESNSARACWRDEARRGEARQRDYSIRFPIGSARQFCHALSGPVTRSLGHLG
jgi:hypothetical protein